MLLPGRTTLSPLSALTGMKERLLKPSRAAKRSNSSRS